MDVQKLSCHSASEKVTATIEQDFDEYRGLVVAELVSQFGYIGDSAQEVVDSELSQLRSLFSVGVPPEAAAQIV